jgi:hypothetical protein
MKKSVEFSVTYHDKQLTFRLYLLFVNASFFIPKFPFLDVTSL